MGITFFHSTGGNDSGGGGSKTVPTYADLPRPGEINTLYIVENDENFNPPRVSTYYWKHDISDYQITEEESVSDSFKKVSANGQEIQAEGADTLKITAGEGFEIKADPTNKELTLTQRAGINSVMERNVYPVTKGQTVTNTFQSKGFVMAIEPHNALLKNQRTGQIGTQITLDKGDTWEHVSSIDGDLVVLETEQRFGYRAEEKEWGFFTLSANQTTNLTEGKRVLFDTSQGNISTANGVITLKAGKIYKMEGVLYTYSTQNAILYHQFYNLTDNCFIGIKGSTVPVGRTSGGTGQNIASCILQTNKDIEIELRISSIYPSTDTIDRIDMDSSYMTIEEIAPQVQFMDEYYYVPTGTIFMLGQPTPPPGWLECNGAALDRTVYKRLFDSIGTTFGEGDGSTTFNIPDLRGEFVRGWDHSRGIDIDRDFGSWQEATKHVYMGASSYGTVVTPVNSMPQNCDSLFPTVQRSYPGGSVGKSSTLNKHYTSRPRNLALLPCIKY